MKLNVKNARRIVGLLRKNSDRFCDHKITKVQHSRINRRLWDIVVSLGTDFHGLVLAYLRQDGPEVLRLSARLGD